MKFGYSLKSLNSLHIVTLNGLKQLVYLFFLLKSYVRGILFIFYQQETSIYLYIFVERNTSNSNSDKDDDDSDNNNNNSNTTTTTTTTTTTNDNNNNNNNNNNNIKRLQKAVQNLVLT